VNLAPYFSTSLPKLIETQVGEKVFFELPEVIEPENDRYNVTVNMGLASIFLNFYDMTFRSNKTQAIHVGTYTINIFLTDQYQKKSTYVFHLKILPELVGENNQTTITEMFAT
jgi:hypothetical protein